MRATLRFALAALVLGVAVSLPAPSPGCAAIGRHPVHISSEDAIIVWDAGSKIQHFIRRASFQTLAPDFGFLVPTPAAPKLTEVGDAAFDALAGVIRPRVRQVFGGVEFFSLFFQFPGNRADMVPGAMKDGVRVLDSAKVGGFNAVVLEADDPTLLEEWLKTNGYPSTPEISGWLGPYLTQKWKVTAFKIETDPATGRAVGSDKAVKMTFAAEQPFFPYREPEVKVVDQKDSGARVLRVYFLSTERAAGTLGSLPWHAETVWADELRESAVDQLAVDLEMPRKNLPDQVWLTAFKDTSSPRPGSAEVFFAPSKDTAALHPPDVLVPGPPVVIPIELVLLFGVVVFGCGYGIVRSMRKST